MIYTNNLSMSSAAGLAVMMDNSLGGGASGAVASALGRAKHMTPDQINLVAKDFESMFVSQMLEQMFGDSVGADAFGDSDTSDVYKGMMMDAYGKQITNAGGIGIADYVKKELLMLQEK